MIASPKVASLVYIKMLCRTAAIVTVLAPSYCPILYTTIVGHLHEYVPVIFSAQR